MNAVKQFAIENIEEYRRPSEIEIVSEFPLTRAGKIDYRAVEQSLSH